MFFVWSSSLNNIFNFFWSLNLIFCLTRLFKHFLFFYNVLFWNRKLKKFSIILFVIVLTFSSSWNIENCDDSIILWLNIWFLAVQLFIFSKRILLLIAFCHECRNSVSQMSSSVNNMLSSVACHFVLIVVILHQLRNSKHLCSQCLIILNQNLLAYLRFWTVFWFVEMFFFVVFLIQIICLFWIISS